MGAHDGGVDRDDPVSFGITYWRLAKIEECWSARAANTG